MLDGIDLFLAVFALIGGAIIVYYLVKHIASGDYQTAHLFKRGLGMPREMPLFTRKLLFFCEICIVILLIKVGIREVAAGHATFVLFR